MNHQISTQWPFKTISEVQGNAVIPSVVLIYNTSTSQKGTGWLVSNNHILTNEHVIRDCGLANNIVVVFSDNSQYRPNTLYQDSLTDIAALEFRNHFTSPALKIKTDNLDIGSQIYTWGHPLGYSGPAPILSVGYLAGRNSWQPQGMSKPQFRLVLNAALNPGNSGGPVFPWNDSSVCGIAVTKHAPIPPFLKSAIDALANNSSGVVFKASDHQGNQHQFVESQLVAQVLEHFQSMTQVVLGEAIMPVDITNFLDTHSIPWIKA